MASPDSVLVSGATGLVGRRLVAELLDRGVQVRALTRNLSSGAARLDPKVVLVRWDGVRPEPDALRGVDAVVHLAGEPIFGGRLSGARRRRATASRVDSTRAIVEEIGALPEAERPTTLISASAVGYYGDGGERELDEQSPPGSGFLADLCREWERAASGAEAHGLRVVCPRIGVVLSREGGALALMRRPFRLGLGGRLGSGRQWFPWIHREDLVGLIAAALGEAAFRGPVNAVAPEPVRNRELTEQLARALGRPARLPVPAFALRTLLGAELAAELLDSRRVLPRRASALGFHHRYPTLAGAIAAETADA